MATSPQWVRGDYSLWSLAVPWLVALLVVLGLARYRRRSAFYNKYLGHLPGRSFQPPLLGDLIHYVYRLNMDNIWNILKQEHTDFNMKPFRFWLGETPSVVISAPEDLAVMLSSNKLIDKPRVGYSPIQGFFGNGLITLNGASWKHHRRVLTPAFHFQVLDRYVKVFARRAHSLADALGQHPAVRSGDSLDFLPEMSAFVSETIWETAFGLDGTACLKEKPEMKKELLDAMAFIHSVTTKRIFYPLLSNDFVFRLTPMYSKTKRCEKLITDVALNIIRAKKRDIAAEQMSEAEDIESDHTDDELEDDVGTKKRFAFLDLVLRQDADDAVLSEDEILQEVRTLLAVQQTSATTLSFTAVLLAMHPEVQETARREVTALRVEGLGPRAMLSRMHYLDRVIKESLRLFPNTPIIGRVAREELQLADGKTVVPPGCLVTAVLAMTHRNPRHWPDAERFDPDRFLPERAVDRHPYAFVPFSAGPRNCIGQRYALLQMKAVLAELLSRFRILPGPGCHSLADLHVSMNLFMYVVGGFNVRLQPV